MTPEEIDQRTERFRVLQMEMADPLHALQAFGTKMAILAPSLERVKRAGSLTPEAIGYMRELSRLYRNHADDHLRMGNLLRRAADVLEPVLDDLEGK